MSPWAGRGIRFAAAVFAAGVLQAVLAGRIELLGARPDFLLTTSLVGSMFCSDSGAAALGMTAALIHGALAAPPRAGLGSLLVSRTLVCFMVGWLEDRMYRDSVVVAIAIVTAGTLAAECLFFVFDPQRGVLHWAKILALTVLWNGILSVPVYYGVRSLLGRLRSADAMKS